MQNIEPDDAARIVQAFIFLLEENLKIPTKPEYEGEEVVDKERWTVPLINELQQAIDSMFDSKSSWDFDRKDFNIQSSPDFNHERAEYYIEDIVKELSEDLEMHEGIRSSDDQYEDPQEWWLSPLVESINNAKHAIYLNTMY
jgi:hypothetical protein